MCMNAYNIKNITNETIVLRSTDGYEQVLNPNKQVLLLLTEASEAILQKYVNDEAIEVWKYKIDNKSKNHDWLSEGF